MDDCPDSEKKDPSLTVSVFSCSLFVFDDVDRVLRCLAADVDREVTPSKDPDLFFITTDSAVADDFGVARGREPDLDEL